MAQLTKDSVEAPQTAAVAGTTQSAPQSKPAPAGAQLRADARSLEIPVKVHGSRVSDAPQGAAPRTEPFEEQTSTMIVFPQGSVIRMSTAVNVGQMLVVTNLKTRQDAICRVVKVRTFTNMQGYVEVEFTHKQEGYWGVQFSGNNATPANGSAPSTASPQVKAPAPTVPVSSVSAPRPVVVPPPSIVAPVVPVAPVAPVAPVKNVHEVEPAPVSSTINAAPPALPFVAPPVSSVVPSVPIAQTIHAAPLPPPTFVPPPPPPVSAAPVVHAIHVAPPAPPVVRPQTPFVWIGTQEEVQPAASATATNVKPGTPAPFSRSIASLSEVPKIQISTIELPGLMPEASASAASVLPFPASAPEPSVAPLAAQLTMSELRGDEPSSALNSTSALAGATILDHPEIAEEKAAESSRAVFGSLSGGASFGAARSESAEVSSPEDLKGTGSSSNRTLVAVCIGVVFAAVIGGGLYFRSLSAGKSGNGQSGAPSTLQSQQVAAEQNALQNSSHGGPVATVEGAAAPAVTVSASSNNSGSASKGIPVAKQPVSKTASMMNGATIEHPLTPQRADNGGPSAAPSLDASAVSETSSGNALPGVISSSSIPAPVVPAPQPEAPVVSGGHVAQPKLIYRALPVYPISARQAGIQGDVVINTKIDPKGNVIDMHVVSGPAMLRQAALDALRRWRYEPSTLDGQPIAVQMLVTIKFSR